MKSCVFASFVKLAARDLIFLDNSNTPTLCCGSSTRGNANTNGIIDYREARQRSPICLVLHCWPLGYKKTCLSSDSRPSEVSDVGFACLNYGEINKINLIKE